MSDSPLLARRHFIAGVGGTLAAMMAYGETLRPPTPDQPSPSAKAFLHPGLLHSREEISWVKKQISAGAEPWKSAWAALQKSSLARLDRKARPEADVVRDLNGKWRGAKEIGDDANAAYTQALHGQLSGEAIHTRKAVEILDAWARTLKSITGHDAKLLAGIVGYKFCNAAELLRHGGADWPEADQLVFRRMLREVFEPLTVNYFPKANGNWDASMIATNLSIAVHCDDRPAYQKALEYFLKGEGNGALPNYVWPTGQCQESTRDQAHTQLGLAMLSEACETAWKQHDDLWGALDDRLALGFEYTARYNLGEEVEAKGKISPLARGEWRPVYAKVVYHYHLRKGKPMPYSRRALAQTPPDLMHWDHLPWAALMFAQLPE